MNRSNRVTDGMAQCPGPQVVNTELSTPRSLVAVAEMGGLAEALRVLHGCVSLCMRLEEVGAP